MSAQCKVFVFEMSTVRLHKHIINTCLVKRVHGRDRQSKKCGFVVRKNRNVRAPSVLNQSFTAVERDRLKSSYGCLNAFFFLVDNLLFGRILVNGIFSYTRRVFVLTLNRAPVVVTKRTVCATPGGGE